MIFHEIWWCNDMMRWDDHVTKYQIPLLLLTATHLKSSTTILSITIFWRNRISVDVWWWWCWFVFPEPLIHPILPLGGCTSKYLVSPLCNHLALPCSCSGSTSSYMLHPCSGSPTSACSNYTQRVYCALHIYIVQFKTLNICITYKSEPSTAPMNIIVTCTKL